MPTTVSLPRRVSSWLRIPWLPVAGTVIATVVILILDPPMRDLQAALARESAHRSGVGTTYWFDWFGGVAPGSYSLIVPTLTSAVGSLPLLCLSTLFIAALAYPLSRHAEHPTLLTWSVSLAAVLNMFSGRVTFAVGVSVALLAVRAVQLRRPLAGGLLLAVSGLASPLVPAFAGIIVLPFAVTRRHHNATVWWALGGAALGVAVPYLLFGAPGSQPYPWTTLFWSLIIGTGATAALYGPGACRQTPARWIAPLALVAAVILFFVPTGVGSNMSRFFYLVLPGVVLYWSLKSPKVLALLLSPALVYALFVALYDQVTVADSADSKTLYAPLTTMLDILVDDGQVDNHRVELVDTRTHAGSYLLTDSVPLARGWENQSDMRYNPVFYDRGALDAGSYRHWLADNAVAFVAVAADPLPQQDKEAELIGQGLPYLDRIWSNPYWALYRVESPTPIVPAPLRLLESTASAMSIEVPEDAVGVNHLLRIRPNRYLTATSPTVTEPACLASTPDENWTVVRFDAPGRYTLAGQFSVGAALDPLPTSC